MIGICTIGLTKACGIYAISRASKREIYIGQSINISRRIGEHNKHLKSGKHACSRLQNVFNKYGGQDLVVSVLADEFDPTDKDVLTLAEQEFIDFYRQTHEIYNTAPSAWSNAGIKFTIEQRARMGRGMLGKSGPMLGKKHAPETIAKFSAALKGRLSPWKGKSPSAETREKMRAAKVGKASNFKGKNHSEENKLRQSLLMKGRDSPNKGKFRSKEANEKQSLSMMGKPAWNKGQSWSEETKTKMSIAAKTRVRSRATLAQREKMKQVWAVRKAKAAQFISNKD